MANLVIGQEREKHILHVIIETYYQHFRNN